MFLIEDNILVERVVAYLYYENLGVNNSANLMRNAFSGLEEFHNFLAENQKFLESEKAIKHLCWEEVSKKDLLSEIDETDPKKRLKLEKEITEQKGYWIQLVEPDHAHGNFESVFKLFLDENLEEISEGSLFAWKEIGLADKECVRCKGKNKKPKMSYATEERAHEVASYSKQNLSAYDCPHGNGWHLTSHKQERFVSNKSNRLSVIDRDPNKERLLLDRLPSEDVLFLRPDTYQIRCQLKALASLQDCPQKHHVPLLNLMEGSKYAKWGTLSSGINRYESSIDWKVLTDENRSGTSLQRNFVQIALNTPDFAFLEGPPGSGKTTAICELILQLVLEGKRILLCASTHVAVDNVLERLMDESNEHHNLVIPVRIGDVRSVSEKAKPYRLDEFLKTEKTRMLNGLAKLKTKSNSQELLGKELTSNKHFIERFVLDGANLVCGTTIGILQHPDIKSKEQHDPEFDVMIIDEASKTTFQEFLVPALLAKKWILVGDIKQLSPFIDDEAVSINLQQCLPSLYQREACKTIFNAGVTDKSRQIALINETDPKVIEFYQRQAEKNGLLCSHEGNTEFLEYSDIVIGDSKFIEKHETRMPLDIVHIQGDVPSSIHRIHESFISKFTRDQAKEDSDWENELGWRLARLYEQRTLSSEGDNSEAFTKLERDIGSLLPYDAKSRDAIQVVQRVAFPSILESLQVGFGVKNKRQRENALTNGLPKDIFDSRAVTLDHQHRMHPDIAAFSHKYIYNEKALYSDDAMVTRRTWAYSQDARVIWRDIRGKSGKFNDNPDEIDAIRKELNRFKEWAINNPRDDSGPWEVAILTFYRGQERSIRNMLRKLTGNHRGFRHFSMKNSQHGNVYLDIQVCTVDRFQGHEADVVFLSFVKDHATSFLQSPNRLNVAVTRAKYQLIVFGNREKLAKKNSIVKDFIDHIGSNWEREI